MSENEIGDFCDEQKILEYVYGDVDDNDIFATESFNVSFTTESDPRNETNPSTDVPSKAHNSEVIQENEDLKETMEKLQKEKDILELRISELYKTAKAELERKDKRLKDLEKEKDNILFRRGNNFVKNKPSIVNSRLPVLQQVEIDLRNEDFQNFNTRYRIPKKVPPSDDKEIFENMELNKRLNNKHTQNEKYITCLHLDNPRQNTENDEKLRNNSKRLFSCKAYDDNGKNIEKNKEFKDYRGPLTNKDSKDKHVTEHGRPRERSDLRTPVDRENGPIRSLSDKDRHSSCENTKAKCVLGQSTMSTRFKDDSPENYTRKPRSPSRERESLKKRSRSKSMNEEVKLEKRIYSTATAREKQQVHLPRERNRSPSDGQLSHGCYKTEYVQERSKSSSRYKNVSPENHVREPKMTNKETQEEFLKKRCRSKSMNVDAKLEEKSIYFSSVARENERLLSRGRSRSPPNKRDVKKPRTPSRERQEELPNQIYGSELTSDNVKLEEKPINPSLTFREQVGSSRLKSRSPSTEQCVRKPSSPSRKEREEEFPAKRNRNKSCSEDIKSNKEFSCSTSRPEVQVNPFRERNNLSFNDEAFTSNENPFKGSRNKIDSYKVCSPAYCKRQPRTPSMEREGDLSDAAKKSKSVGKDTKPFSPSKKKEYVNVSERCNSRLNEEELRETYKRRSRSVSNGRDRRRRRRSRSMSKERYRNPRERERLNVRNGRRFYQDRSKSSSVEKDRRERFRNKPNSPTRRDRHENERYKYRKNRSRERHSDLKNIDCRARDIRKLRERVLRYNRDRGTQAFKKSIRENQGEGIHKSDDKRKAFINNETDQSDLDDLKLHLSGESDQDILNNKHTEKRRDEILNSEDAEFKLVKDMGPDSWHMTVEELERLVEMRKREFNKVSNLTNARKVEIMHDELEEYCNVQFIYPDEKLSDDEEYDDPQVQRKTSIFLHSDNYIEELDYEHSRSEFLNNFTKHNKQELSGYKSISNQSKNIYNGTDVQHQNEEHLKNLNEEKMEKYNADEVKHNEELGSIECTKKQFRTVFGLRQRQKLMKREDVDSLKTSKIIRRNTQVSQPKDINIFNCGGLNEKSETDGYEKSSTDKGNRSHGLEKQEENKVSSKNGDIYEDNREIKDEQGFTKKKRSGHDDLLERINEVKQKAIKAGQEYHSTRDEISATLRMTKRIDSKGPGISEDSCKSGVVKCENELKKLRKEKEEVDIATNKRERITLSAYKSRKKSIDGKTMDIDLKELENCSADVSKNSQNETCASRKNCSETEITSNKEKYSAESPVVSIDELPKSGEGVVEVLIKNKNVSDESSNRADIFVHNNSQVVQKTIEERKNSIIEINPQQSTSTISKESDMELQEHVIIKESSSGVVDSSNPWKQENDSCKDLSSFIHDFSISDDEDIHEHVTPNKGKSLAGDCNGKITIISNITIQTPSYTPPHPSKTAVNMLQTSENVLQVNDSTLKESGNIKSRKSLFKTSVSQEETEKAVTNISGTKTCNSHSLSTPYITAENKLQKPDISSVIENNSDKTKDSEPTLANSEYVDEVQEAVKNIMGDTSPQYSLSSKSNTFEEHFDTPELQKCLEEDITDHNADNVNYLDTGAGNATLSLKVKPEECKSEVQKNMVKSSKERKVHEDQTKPMEKNHAHTKNKRAETPSPEEKQVDFDAEKFFELFGPMTPSPSKTEEILEKNVNRVKQKQAKRNIANCVENNVDDVSFKIRDKNDNSKENNLNKIGPKANENLESVGEGNQDIVTVLPKESEKDKPLLPNMDNKEIDGLKNFCANPTYIPNIRDTPKALFESPCQYIEKKNQEMKEKIKRNLKVPLSNEIKNRNDLQKIIEIDEDCVRKETCKENLDAVKMEQNNLSKKSIATNVVSVGTEDFVLEDKGKKKTKPKKLHTKRQIENVMRNKDDNAPQKVNSKGGSDKNREENKVPNLPAKGTKKSLNQSSSMGDKKARNPSFKIKINIPKKGRGKKRRIFDSDEDSDSLEEPKKVDQEKQSDKGEVFSCNVECGKVKNKKQKVLEDDCIVSKQPSLSDSQCRPINNILEIESKNSKLNKKEIKPKPKRRTRKVIQAECHDAINEKNKREDIKEETCERLQEVSNKREQKGSYHENIVMKKEGSRVMEDGEKNFKECTQKNKKISVSKDRAKTIEKAPVKTVKRITPKRIGDCTFNNEQNFNDSQAKRELFKEHPESVVSGNKRRRLSDDSNVTYTELRTTVEEDIMDNSSHTRIKIQETQLSIEVAPNCSPLPRIEQTYDILSKNTSLSKGGSVDSTFIDARHPQLQPTHEGVYPDIVLNSSENTLPEINVDTKDLTMLGPIEKVIYHNLSEFSLSDKSMLLFTNIVGDSKKSDKDSNDDNIEAEKGKNVNNKEQLTFMNFLNNKSPNTSTPIKNNRPIIAKSEVCIPTQSNDDVQTSSIVSGTTLSTSCSISGHQVNVSGDKTASRTTCSESVGSGTSKTHVKFSRTLKRDRRRPISVVVLD